MNKTITINLGGQIFHVEESVYTTLLEYLDSLKNYFKSDPDGNEIISDIEYRLAELFIEEQEDRTSAVSKEQVEAAIRTMGTVSDFQDATESEEHTTLLPSTPITNESTSEANKKLLRDPDDRVLSGVSSGLGHYFGINALWVRIAFLLMFFMTGIGLIPYIILWIIMPKAVSSSDKLAMKGKPVNLNTLRENVKSEIENNSGSAVDFVNQLLQYTGRALTAFLKIMAILLGFVFLIAGIAAIVGLGYLALYEGGIPFRLDSFFGLNRFWYIVMRIAIFIAIAIPVILFTVLFLRLLFNRNFLTDKRYVYTLGMVWLLSALIIVGAGMKLKSEFRNEGLTAESFDLQETSDTLTVKLPGGKIKNAYHWSVRVDKSEGVFKMKNDSLFIADVALDVVSADIPEYRVDIIKSAKGKTVKDAEVLSYESNYYWEQIGNELIISDAFNIPSKSKWRNQSIRVVLNVPYGRVVKLDRSTRKIIDDIKNIQNIYDNEMAGKSWTSTEAGLSCVDCKEGMATNISATEGQVIRAIDVEGALSIDIIQSDKDELSYSSGLSDHYDFRYRGDKLLIRPIDDNIEGESIARTSATIYVTELSDLYIKGLAEVDLKNLRGKHIDIKIEGAAQTDFELNYKSAEIEIEGAANVDMSGELNEMSLRAEGMMRIDADNLQVIRADIDMQGAMRADFHVTEEMEISLEGPSYVKYKGDPRISKSLSGPSRLVRM